MIELVKESEYCSGCSACMAACVKNAIKMETDSEGFLYPKISEACNNCGMCAKACPHNNKNVKSEFNKALYAGISNDDKIWKESSSGGAFSEICNAYGDSDTVIFGAAFDGLYVAHKYVVGIDNISEFRKSKYVQSDMKNCYREAIGFLKEGKKVLFSGTPCQIKGLKSFLKLSKLNELYNDNLLCVDFICHGVGSPKVFWRYTEYLSKKYNSKLIRYSFRNKKYIRGRLQTFCSVYEFENKKNICNPDCIYVKTFIQKLSHRPSCGNACVGCGEDRASDITIADCKDKALVPRNDNKNYSTLIFNSEKGFYLLDALKNSMYLALDEFSNIRKFNFQFYEHSEHNKNREPFFKELDSGASVEKLLLKYYIKPKFSLYIALLGLIPENIKNILKKVIKRSENEA